MRILPLGVLLGFGIVSYAALPSKIGATEVGAPGPRIEGAPSMQGINYSIFDSTTGVRTGYLKIEHVDFEYRRQGFMTVAWRPQVVLVGVELEIGTNLIWESQGMQILRALTSLGQHDDMVLRNVKVHLSSPKAQEIIARQARLTPMGSLEMLQASVSIDGRPATGDETYILHLTGPKAGQLVLASTSRPHGIHGDFITSNSVN